MDLDFVDFVDELLFLGFERHQFLVQQVVQGFFSVAVFVGGQHLGRLLSGLGAFLLVAAQVLQP